MRRAMSVAIILVSNGVAPKKIKLVPAGEHLPIARNIEPFFDQNRRVEILSANSQALIQAFIRERDCTTIDSACKPTELGVVSIEKDKDFGVVIKADELSTVVSSRPSQGSLEQLATELTMIGGEGVDERVEFNSAHKRNALNATKIRKNVLQGTILRPPLSFKNAIRKALIFNTKYIIE